jgi:hypothetical protein
MPPPPRIVFHAETNGAYRFAKLPDGRYQIQFDDEGDTLPRREGLRFIEYLLKQAGKSAGVIAINKALYGMAAAKVGVDWGATAAPQGKRLGARPERGDKEQITMARDALAESERFLNEAKEKKNKALIERYEGQCESWKEALAVLEAPQEATEAEAASEKVRKKLANNFNNTLKTMKNAGLIKTAEHFKAAIQYDEYRWTYLPDPRIAWAFEPESPAN